MSKLKTAESTPMSGKASPETPKSPLPKPTSAGFKGLPFLFDRQSYILMGAGILILIIGYVMMAGGRSDNPNVFDADALYSFRRITLAPLLVLVGFAVEGYAIMRRPKKS